MSKSNLIVLNGFAGSGKSSIAKRYIKDHPLALVIEGDELIVNMGHWVDHEPEARRIIFELTKSLASTHLAQGYDVVLPYLVTSASHITKFEQLAQEADARFYNFLLFNEKESAIHKLMERGTWGEAGLDPLGDKDMPVISDLYDRMEKQLESQKSVIVVHQAGLTEEDSYKIIKDEISRLSPKKEL